MSDFVTQARSGAQVLQLGSLRIGIVARGIYGPDNAHGLILSGYAPDSAAGPEDYLTDLLLAPEHRESTYQLVDAYGLLICRDLRSTHESYRDVRGRSSRGRLSQGEYYHHDGCTSPTKPRGVEIRYPHQEVGRQIATAVSPFRATVYAMLRQARACLRSEDLLPWRERLDSAGELPEEELDTLQGLLTRAVRRELSAEAGREFFRGVDEFTNAYREPWQMGESRLICNAHPRSGPLRTMQHRRAYLKPHTGGVVNGKLVKRWPAEELC